MNYPKKCPVIFQWPAQPPDIQIMPKMCAKIRSADLQQIARHSCNTAKKENKKIQY